LHADKFWIVGGPYSVWCLFDTHSVDEELEGYNVETVDDLIGFPSFARSIIEVGWLVDNAGAIGLPRFEDHNGVSAKRQATDSDRKETSAICPHPKVWMIADLIGSSRDIGRRLLTDHSGVLDDMVTRDVTLSALLRVWCATNEHTEDGVWYMNTLDTLDNAAGIVGFGAAMAAVEWAIYDPEKHTVTLPNFTEYNAPSKHSARSTGVKRQARYREKLKESDASHYASPTVTGDVTGDVREEKRREEKRRDIQTLASALSTATPKTNR
jgi:hypothetical protein